MSTAIHALATRLKSQINELEMKRQSLVYEISEIETLQTEVQQKIHDSSEIPTYILPEQEMARLHYILSEQAQQDKRALLHNALNHELEVVQEKLIRLNTELRRLEKYQEQKHIQEQQKIAKAEQHLADDQGIRATTVREWGV